MLGTLYKYIQSYYFILLRKRLQGLRLTFFIEIQELSSMIETDNLSESAGIIFDKISVTFPKILELITRIESLEKKVSQYNIFNHNDYIITLIKDVLNILRGIQNNLREKQEQLFLIEEEQSRYPIPDQLLPHRELSDINSKKIKEQLYESISMIENLVQELEKLLESHMKESDEKGD